MNRAPQIAMVAGEASGDLLAGLLLDGMTSLWPDLLAQGIGGPQMEQRGFESWWSSERLAVHGYNLDVFLKLAGILRIRRQLRQRLEQGRPDVFIGIDAPDFNLGLESQLRQQGIKTVHFVCPSVWAWRAERIEKIRRAVDHVLCIFPFEPQLLAKHGIAGTYVGHPLAQSIPLQVDCAHARLTLGLPQHGKVLAILPGSRQSEILHIAPVFFAAAALLHHRNPDLKIVVPAVPAHWELLNRIAKQSGVEGCVTLVRGQSHAVLAACDCTLIASGTATLEAALFKRPMVIAYRMGEWAWRAMRQKQLQPWVGLPNILCQSFVVPELIQDAATPSALAEAVARWLNAPECEPGVLHILQQRFMELHEQLRRDTRSLAAQVIDKVIHG